MGAGDKWIGHPPLPGRFTRTPFFFSPCFLRTQRSSSHGGPVQRLAIFWRTQATWKTWPQQSWMHGAARRRSIKQMLQKSSMVCVCGRKEGQPNGKNSEQVIGGGEAGRRMQASS